MLPQFLLCGLLVPRDQLPEVLYWISNLLPLSYAVDAMRTITVDPAAGEQVAQDVGIILGFVLVLVTMGAATLRRRTD